MGLALQTLSLSSIRGTASRGDGRQEIPPISRRDVVFRGSVDSFAQSFLALHGGSGSGKPIDEAFQLIAEPGPICSAIVDVGDARPLRGDIAFRDGQENWQVIRVELIPSLSRHRQSEVSRNERDIWRSIILVVTV